MCFFNHTLNLREIQSYCIFWSVGFRFQPKSYIHNILMIYSFHKKISGRLASGLNTIAFFICYSADYRLAVIIFCILEHSFFI